MAFLQSFVHQTVSMTRMSLRPSKVASRETFVSCLASYTGYRTYRSTSSVTSNATTVGRESLSSERVQSGSQASTSSGRVEENSQEAGEHRPLLPGLYLVGTPIGNLEDITLRALRVLKEVEVVLAEDTRHSRKLLNHYDISTPLMSFHEHNERSRKEQVLAQIGRGARVAMISDAGMPLISDPGGALVAATIAEGHPVIPIPGPSAVLSAIVASGLPATSFMFCGFLPPKSGARVKAIEAVAGVPASLIFYVPPHSLVAVLEDLAGVLGPQRQCAVAREMTKLHEEFYRGSLTCAADRFKQQAVRGEITLIVEGCSGAAVQPSAAQIEQEVQQLLNEGVSTSSTAKILAKSLGLSRSAVYDVALSVKSKQPYLT